MTPAEHIAYGITIALLLVAMMRFFLKWSRTGNPEVLLAGRVFGGLALVLLLLWCFL